MTTRLLFLLSLFISTIAFSCIDKANAKGYVRPKAFLVMDAHTGKVISSHNSDKRLYPASMTKMMTLFLTFDHIKSGKLKWDDKITVSRNASHKEPSNLALRPGDKLTVRQAVLALITKSANDAATALGEKIGGSEQGFAKLMNQKAAQLEMTSTAFYNPSGLPNKHQKSTAHDMAKLAQALILRHNDYYGLFSTKSFKYRGSAYRNHNKLLGKFQGLDGIKTGYTRAAGFNLAASAQRGPHRLVTVVMGYDSQRQRDQKIMNLMNQGFKKLNAPGPYLVALKRKPQKFEPLNIQLAEHRPKNKSY